MKLRNKPAAGLCSGGMPLTGEYEPSAASWARDQVDLYERSGGTEGTDLSGRPVIILTSLGGAPQNPVWYHNLTANPHVELQDGPVKKDYQAREVHDSERAAWWERAVAAWPDYAKYQQQTTRTIPVFVLTPIGA